ncbi:MAG: selenocysteine-specific translation elongation factor [bacterium]|nr:MAG: selenocysteine-specific translation elongation factor [bacterium]
MNIKQRQYVIGLAGHIDHGKTALVKALTGIDTDRLKEEKARGITIDLGFAHLSQNITLIDVPGHERLIKNMVAGVSTIDMVLFVIAADDGIMPQTREHLDIVKLLGIKQGLFVITKVDLVAKDWLELVEEEVRNLLQGSVFDGSPILRFSAISGAGIEEVRQSLFQLIDQMGQKEHDGIFRLPVDRAFSKAGFGTIVTGSVISGSLKTGDSVEILPEKIVARIRGLQSHDSQVDEVEAGFRAAVNLVAGDRVEIVRGQVLVQPGFYEPVQLVNTHVQLLPGVKFNLKNQVRVRLHLHTSEILGRVILMDRKEIHPGEEGLVQIRLESPVYASYKDRFIIRQYSPQITVGGGTVLETNPPRFRKRFAAKMIQNLKKLLSGSTREVVLACFPTIEIRAMSLESMQVRSGLSRESLLQEIEALLKAQEIFHLEQIREKLYCSRNQFLRILAHSKKLIERYHQRFPGRTGIVMAELISHLIKQYPEDIIRPAIAFGVKEKSIVQTGDFLSLPSFQTQLGGKEKELLERIETAYRSSGFIPPTIDELIISLGVKESIFRELINILREQQQLVIIEEKLFYHSETFEKVVDLIRQFFSTHAELKVGDLKDLTGTTRKHAIPLLSYLDAQGYTRREGDVRLAGPKLQN